MTRPNVFIAGAPKCGTTSVASWLAQHPDVFVSDPKEPSYFCFDVAKRHQRSRGEYEDLFAGASGYAAIVDASTRYLFSQVAIPEILAYNPQARLIVLVRNPCDMFFSLHNHLYQVGIEVEAEPERAWALQAERHRDERFRKANADPDSLQYADICRLGEQVERLCNIVPVSQRRLVVFDDLAQHPDEVYRSLLDFLGLTPVTTELKPRNQAFVARSKALKKAVRAGALIKHQLGLRTRWNVLNTIKSLNRKPVERRPSYAASPFYRELQAFFAADVERLSRLLERDLSAWVSRKAD